MLPRAIKYKLFEIFPNIGFVPSLACIYPSTAAKQQVSHATPSCGAFTAHIYHSIHDPTYKHQAITSMYNSTKMHL